MLSASPAGLTRSRDPSSTPVFLFRLAIVHSPVTLDAGSVRRARLRCLEINRLFFNLQQSHEKMFPGYEEMLEAWQAEAAARAAVDGRREATVHADVAPCLLFVDPARISGNLRELPHTVRSRFLARPRRRVIALPPAQAADLPLLAPWSRKQFEEFGYFVQGILARSGPDNPRGRRQLDAVEVRLRETLALWVWALMPSIDCLGRRLRGADDCEAPSLLLLSELAPWLSRMAGESLARRPDPLAQDGVSGGIDHLHSLVVRLSDEGRRQRLVLRDSEGVAQELFGVALQDHYLAKTRAFLRAHGATKDVRARALSDIGMLETLAKACLASTSVFRADVAAWRSFDSGMEALEGQGPFAALLDPQTRKRQRNAATQVARAAHVPEYVLPSGQGAGFAFEAHELALVAFFSGVDPYTFCAQHVLLAPEVLAARALGHAALGRSAGPSEDWIPISALLAWDPVLKPPIDQWECELLTLRGVVCVAVNLSTA